MSQRIKLAASLVGAGALVASVFSDALASRPSPLHDQATAHRKDYTVNGRLTVTDVLRVQKNISVFGNFYAKKKAEVDKGLLVKNGLSSDNLVVTGGTKLGDVTSSGNLQAGTLTSAGSISGGSLALTGAATVGGTLTASGRISANGVDAGAGGLTTSGTLNAASLTTTGTVAAGNITATGIADTGTLSAGSIATTGTLSAGAATFTNLTATGPVDFSKATITGLSLSNLSGGGALSLQSLTLGTANTAATTGPLTLLGPNNSSVSLGVNSSGALTANTLSLATNLNVGGAGVVGGDLSVNGATGVIANGIRALPTTAGGNTLGTLTLTGANVNVAGNLAVSGNFSLAGTSTFALSNLVAPNTSGTTTPGSLGLQGSNITLTGNVVHTGPTSLNGNTTLGSTTDLIAAPSSHIVANGNRDLAGTVSANIPNASAAGIPVPAASVTFTRAYASAPVVVVTPTSHLVSVGDYYYVTPTTTGFTIFYTPQFLTVAANTVGFSYIVVGQ